MDSALSQDPRLVREFVARFAAQFPEPALTALAGRLLSSTATQARWEALIGEVVACAVYNQIPLDEAERLVARVGAGKPSTP